MSEEREEYFDDEDIQQVVHRYENMLRKKTQYFFDVYEFEDIVDHYIGIKKFNRALQVIDLASNQHPYSTELSIKKAQVLINKNQPSEALNILKNVEKFEASNYDIFVLEGVVYNLLGNEKEAIRQFNKALLLTNDYEYKDEIFYNVATSFKQSGNFEIAIKYLKQAYDLNKENYDVIFDLAYCYEETNNYEKSILFY